MSLRFALFNKNTAARVPGASKRSQKASEKTFLVASLLPRGVSLWEVCRSAGVPSLLAPHPCWQPLRKLQRLTREVGCCAQHPHAWLRADSGQPPGCHMTCYSQSRVLLS